MTLPTACDPASRLMPAGVAGSPQVGPELETGVDCSLWGLPPACRVVGKSQILRGIMRLMTVAVLSAAALAALTAVTPASAQAPQRRYAADNTERITVIDQYGRRTTRITVRPRSFLDPGTATKPYTESYTDYAVPPMTYPGEVFPSNTFRDNFSHSWSRMPFPTCFDLPGYCR
jgi:hypothetical protein